jgi:polyisoprenoid-binding protein YceI
MNLKLALTPLAVASLLAGVIAFHPGVAYAVVPMANGTPTLFGQKASYAVDPMHASINFEIQHLELSTVSGRFNKFAGKVTEDPSDLTKSHVEFSADIASIDTAVPARDDHLKTADFFDAAKYPKLTFKSTALTKSQNGYIVVGDLTIKDRTKSISIPFRHFGPYKMEGGDNSTRIGVVADPIVIKRSDFGVGSTAKLPDGREGASDNVTIRLSFEAILEK